MENSTPGTSPLRSMARYWPLSLVVILLCGFAAGSYSASRPTTYTADSRLAVGGSSVAAQAIPGFALAAQQTAGNYARFVSTAPVVAAMPSASKRDVVSVSASPIPSSNVVLIEASATSESSARAAAEVAASSLVKQVNSALDVNNAGKTLVEFNAMTAKVTKAQSLRDSARRRVDQLVGKLSVSAQATSAPLADAQGDLEKATTTLATLTVQQNALSNRYQSEFNTTPSQSRLSVVQKAVVTGNDKRSRVERYGVLGVAVGFGLALVLSVLLERRRAARRARRRAGQASDTTAYASAEQGAPALQRGRQVETSYDSTATPAPGV